MRKKKFLLEIILIIVYNKAVKRYYGEIAVKKKIMAVMMGLVMCLSVLTGCNLITRNDKNYYNATVATITYSNGEKQNITKRELITAYNSYGYNYVQNYGYTKQKSVEVTLDSVIDSYLTRKSVEDYYEKEGEVLLNENETTYLWDKTYDAIYSNLKSYLDGYTSNDETNNETSNPSIFKDFTPTVYLDNDLTIRRKTPATTIRATYVARYNDKVAYDFEYKKNGKYVFQELMYDNFQTLLETGSADSKKAWKNAYLKYIDIVKDNYDYLDLKSNKDWFIFELNRVYDILRNNYIAEKYEIIYNKAKEQDSDISYVQTLDVLKNYETKVNADYTTYALQNSSKYASNMLSDIANMDYVLEGDGASNYFFVAPIKITLSSVDQAKLTEYKNLYENEKQITKAEYNNLVASIFDTTRELVTVRNAETGEAENKISVDSLLGKIQTDVAGFAYEEEVTDDNRNTIEDYNYDIAVNKAAAYRKYFYLYNDEDTYKNADYNAVFGVDSNGQALVGDTYNNDNVKEAIVALYNGGDARVGDVSDIVKVDDGFYIFFYAGKVENLFPVTGSGLTLNDKEMVRKLSKTRINIFSSKTVFDANYSENDNFSVFQNMHMNQLRSATKNLEKFQNNIKDLYK